MDVRGMQALVTGGASGLGLATVEALVDAGAHVVALDLPGADRSRLDALGDAVRFASADVTDEVAVLSAVSVANDRGRLGVLVNCAGIGNAIRTVGKNGPFPFDDFERVVRVNLLGTFNVLRLAAAEMVRNEPNAEGERGVVINTASAAAFDGQIGQAAYSASKAGVVGMTLPVARDLASLGVRVMTIAPGTFDTPMLALLPNEARQALAAGIPFPRRLGRPQEFAQLARQIVENPYLNGETIRLDGALRMPPK